MNAKQHYADRYHLQYATNADNAWLYGYIQALGGHSVFEFGCNMGRHLAKLRDQGWTVAGADINERAVEGAHLIHGLDTVDVGDETRLSRYGPKSFDVVFTNSVLSHIENIAPVLAHLTRIAHHHLIMVETRSRTDHQNFWWPHDYPGDVVHSYYAQQVNAVYQVWHLRK